MKEFLFLLLGACAVFGFIEYYQLSGKIDTLTAEEAADKQATSQASINLVDRDNQIGELKARVASLKRQLAERGASFAAVTPPVPTPGTATLIPPTRAAPAVSVAASPSPPTSSTSPSIPSTLTTRSGMTYYGCTLSRTYPDGILFTHAAGVARVRFDDLDPSLATAFNYDPAAAQKYEADEAGRARQQALADQQSEAAKEAAANQQQADLARNAEMNPESNASRALATPAPASNPTSQLSPEDQDQIRQQIKYLESDMREKLGEMASVYERDGYAKAVNSQSAYRDAVAEEADKISELEQQLGQPSQPEIRWVPYYPYYIYPFYY
jgi:hypothetical protein